MQVVVRVSPAKMVGLGVVPDLVGVIEHGVDQHVLSAGRAICLLAVHRELVASGGSDVFAIAAEPPLPPALDVSGFIEPPAGRIACVPVICGVPGGAALHTSGQRAAHPRTPTHPDVGTNQAREKIATTMPVVQIGRAARQRGLA